MEVMEEGDLMDRVPILLQRDRQYYEVSESSLVALDYSAHLSFHFLLSNVLYRHAYKTIASLWLAIPNCPTRNHLPRSRWRYSRFSAFRIICIGQNGRVVGGRILRGIQEKFRAFALERDDSNGKGDCESLQSGEIRRCNHKIGR